MEKFNSQYPVFEILYDVLKAAVKIILPVLILVVVYLLIYALFFALKNKLYNEKNNKGSTENFFRIYASGFISGIMFIMKKLPSFLIMAVVVLALNYVVVFGKTISTYLENQKRIKELSLVVKNLESSQAYARITVNNRTFLNGVPYSSYLVEIFDVNGEAALKKSFTLPGNEIRIDTMVVSFEYSEIGNGKAVNLACPYRIFSEKIDAADGIILVDENLKQKIFEKSTEDVYGLSARVFNERLRDLLEILKDEDLAREMGIRSFIGSSIPIIGKTGESYILKVEGSGGLSFEKEEL